MSDMDLGEVKCPNAVQEDFFGLAVGEVEVQRTGKAGRPKGAKNKRSRDLQKMIQASGQTPGEFMVSVYRCDVKDLASKLKINLEDAFKLQVKCAGDLLPYTHQKITPDMVVEQKFGAINIVSREDALKIATTGMNETENTDDVIDVDTPQFEDWDTAVAMPTDAVGVNGHAEDNK